MTPTRTPPHRPTGPAGPATDAPHVWADMTVEVALAVMAGARTTHLVIHDADGRRTGLVTRDRLAGFRAGPAYTDRVRLSELVAADTAPRT
ncbi:CBS domain-containing protein [Streptomyces sp. NPDC035033]|uniref:CBS domain-containing protein n=1 Tax=Streptomyces sp. NPDC035033 TaxID=3155368 RepID=UPI0033E3AE6B